MIVLTHMQREILRYISLHGGMTAPQASEKGFLNCHGQPLPEFQALIRTHKMVAPRVLTSQPLRIVWQMRDLHSHGETLAKIERETVRQKLKEYAPGGFQLTVRPELRK